MRTRLYLVGTLLLLISTTLAWAQSPPALVPPQDLPGLRDFGKVSDSIYRGGAPGPQGLAYLKQLGVKTIIDLRLIHTDRRVLKGSGFQYVRIPFFAWYPRHIDVLHFLKVVSDPANCPVYVHCDYGADRVGVMIACYRMVVEHWPKDLAFQEFHLYRSHPEVFDARPFLHRVNPDTLARQLASTDMPHIRVFTAGGDLKPVSISANVPEVPPLPLGGDGATPITTADQPAPLPDRGLQDP